VNRTPRLHLRATALALVVAASPAAAKERSEVPDKYKWRLSDLYPSEAAWQKAREDITRRIPALAQHRGHLGDSAEALWRGLDAVFAIDASLQRLSVYASSLSDQDTRASAPRGMRQAAEQLAVDFNAASSFVRPEIIALDPSRVRAFVAQEKRLAPYRHFLDDALRWKPHTLGPSEERILAESDALAAAPRSAYGVLKDADLPWPTVKLSTGEEVRLDTAAYNLHRQSRVKEDRDLVFAKFFGALKQFEATMGSTLYAQVQTHVFTKKVRSFGSSLESALFRDNIPPKVYAQLLADVRRSLPTFHRYLALRKRMLGVEVLRYQDLYVPMVQKVDLSFSPEEARAITLEAVAPLGQEYIAELRRGFEGGWTDYLPTTGKRAGAYSTGVYGVHPYQLLNFNGKYDDLSTLAHESGHSMHTFLANAAQPYATADYPIFVAEVASTLNENLLVHHMLARAKDDATRLSLLGSYLDGLRQTLFRQSQFADFERGIHERVEKGETLTGEALTQLYLAQVREYYGHAKGACRVDDVIGIEWAFIPHFYRDFYVYQYATSLIASAAIAKGIREEAQTGGTKRRDAYLAMLRAGGSEYPMDLLKAAGVDMTTSGPFDAAMAEMSSTMDDIERILARTASATGR
jgi:oligoendopeptidase F